MRNTEWLFDSNSTGSTTFRLITTDGVLIPVTRNPDSSPTYFSFRGGRILGVLVEVPVLLENGNACIEIVVSARNHVVSKISVERAFPKP